MKETKIPPQHIEVRGCIMSVGTAVVCQPGKHETQAVQQFRPGAKSGPNARDAGPLAQRQCCRHIEDLIHLGFFRLGHPAPGIG